MPSGSARPVRGPRPHDVICQTQTPAAPGAPATAPPLYAARTEVGVKFDEIRERDGLVAALPWRASQIAD